MKNFSITNTYTAIVAVFGVVLATVAFVVFTPQAFAAPEFNTHPLDSTLVRVSDCQNCSSSQTTWSTNLNANVVDGDIVSVIMYYHNNGTNTANDTRFYLDPRSSNGGTVNFYGELSSDNGAFDSGSATVTLPQGQSLEFIPGHVHWYANNQGNTSQSAPNGQNGTEAFTGTGMTIGNVLPTAPGYQGTVVFGFRVNGSAAPAVTQCNDGVDNDFDGDIDAEDAACHTDGNANNINSYDPSLTTEYPRATIPVWRAQCNDGIDNDRDGLIDMADGGCSSTSDNDESGGTVTPPPGACTLLPQANNLSARNIDSDSAELRGTYDLRNCAGSVWFEYDTNENDVQNQAGQTTYVSVSNGSSGTAERTVNGLDADERYYYMICAQNGAGTVCDDASSAIEDFTTDSAEEDEPDVSTDSATSIRDDGALMRGEYDTNGTDNVDIFFAWDTSRSRVENVEDEERPSRVDANIEYVKKNVDENRDDTVSERLSGLNENTTYYFALCAAYEDVYRDDVIQCGNVRNFTTNAGDISLPSVPPVIAGKPVVTTEAPSAVGSNYATFSGVFDANGANTSLYFNWGTSTTNLGRTTALTNRGLNSGRVSQFVPSLVPNATYYYRLVGVNSKGTTYGNIVSFRTGASVVSTNTNTTTIVSRTSGGSGSSFVRLSIDDFREDALRNVLTSYEVEYENISNRDLKDVIVTVPLPENARFISTTRGSYARANHAVVVREGSLDRGEEEVFTVTMQIRGAMRTGDLVVASAILAHDHPTSFASESVIAYDVDQVHASRVAGGVGLGAFAGGAGFLPGTLFGWLLVILLLIIIFAVATRRYKIANA